MTSRYRGLPTKVLVDETGRRVAYLSRRFVPQVDEFVAEHIVASGERLDNVAARHLGDPTLYWQICDANRVLDPAELESAPEEGVPARIAVALGGAR